MALQNLRSNTANKRPTASGMVDGQVAINTNATNPGLFFKDAGDGIRKVGPVFIGSSAPNSSPAAGGSTGHSIGEQWLDTSGSRYVVKTWDGTAWRDDDSNYLQLTGGSLSGALTIDNAANIAALDLKFDGDTDTGFYAPAANTLGFVGGGTERLRIDSSGKFGFGTSTVSTAKFTFNSGGTNEVARFESTDAGAYLSFKDSNSSSVNFIEGGADQLSFGTNNAERLRIDSSGNVGIGTSSPSSNGLVTIAETTNARLYLTDSTLGNTYGAQLRGYSTSGLGAFAELGVVDNNSYRTAIKIAQQAESIIFNTVTSERMRIDSSGNVGIGTSSPASKAHIKGGSLTVEHNSPSTGTGQFNINSESNSQVSLSYDDQGHISIGTASAPTGQTGFSEKVRIDSSGNVGIGTSSPVANTPLTLQGPSGYTDTLWLRSTGTNIDSRINFGPTGTGNAQINNATGTDIALQVSGSEKLRIDSSGLHTITASNNSTAVQIRDASNYAGQLVTATDGTFQINARTTTTFTRTGSNTESMRIDSSGRLLLGTTTEGEGDADNLTIADTGNCGITLRSGTSSKSSIHFSDATSGTGEYDGFIVYNQNDRNFKIGTTANTRLTIDSSGNVGIGTSSPSYPLHVNGNAQFGTGSAWRTDTNLFKSTATGGANIRSASGSASTPIYSAVGDEDTGVYFPEANAVAVSTAGSQRLLIDSLGRVGINTTANQAELDVGGLNNASTLRLHSGTHNSQIQHISTASTSALVFWADYNDGKDDTRISFVSDTTEKMRIDSDGNVGIGTTSPSAKLHVAGPARVGANSTANAELQIGAGATGSRNAFIDLVGDTTYSDFGLRIIRNNGGANTTSVIDHRGTGTFEIKTREAAPLVLSTSSTERFRVTSDGNVGIGTSSPDSTLELADGPPRLKLTRNTTASTGNDFGRIVFENNVGTEVSRIDSTSTSGNTTPALRFSNGGAERMRIDSSGNVGVGGSAVPTISNYNTATLHLRQASSGSNGAQLRMTTAASGHTASDGAYLSFWGGDNNVYLFNRENASISFGTNDTERMRLDSSGNLGIGATSLSNKLEVNGNQVLLANGQLKFADAGNSHVGVIKNSGASGNGQLEFLTGSTPTERMRIDSSGRVLIGTTSSYASSNADDLQVGNNTSSAQSGITLGSTVLSSLRFADAGSDSAGVISYLHSDDSMRFLTAGSERLRIDSSGNVGVGTSSPARLFEAKGSASGHFDAAKFSNGQDNGSSDSVSINFGLARTGGLTFDAAKIKAIKENAFTSTPSTVNSALTFETIRNENRTERMRINSSGQLGIGTTSPTKKLHVNGEAFFTGNTFFLSTNTSAVLAGTATGKYIQSDGNLISGKTTTSSTSHQAFCNPNGIVGTIQTSGSSTAYNTSSDYRLKENVVDIADGITRVKQLQPRRFNFIADADTIVDGFIAHEAQTVVPEAVSGTHNEVDDDGKAVMQGIDQSKLVPLLTAALKEAIAKIETLETRVAALEAG